MKINNRRIKGYPDHVRIVRQISKPIIIKFLEEKSFTLNEVAEQIKNKLPKNCDNLVMCECKGGSAYPEWRHQVRWALQDLKSLGKIKFERTQKTYSNF